jgi:16S rRNA (adenine1518-N6/adenine1519-N6)-dimethyltransferase
MTAAIKPRHKARLGQNFLVSPSASRAIVEALGDLSQATVVEIGPGRGALTNLLAPRAKHFLAVEIDPALAAPLEAKGVAVLCRDVLNVDLTELAAQKGARLHVIGNLPYYISTPILMHLCAHEAAVERAVLMAQREVADRVAASPGSRDYGLLSATTQMHARVENLFTLPPEAFHPQPEVYSTVFRLTMHSRFAELEVEAAGFPRFLRQIFALKRKTLSNNLRASGYTAAVIEDAFGRCGVHAQVRAEALSLEATACLFRALHGRG